MNKNFIKQDQYGINFQYSRNQASPLDPHSVITSYADLTGDFLKQVNTYPGQLVALADDISNSDGITIAPGDRKHQGLYWVTNGDNKGQAKFTTYKLATTYESNISYDKIWNTVKIAYTKTFEPWASYITTFNNSVVRYAVDEITVSILPDLYGDAYNTGDWRLQKNSLMYTVSYSNTYVNKAVDDLYKVVWETVTPSLGAAITYENTTRNMLMAMLPDMPYYKPTYSDFNFAYSDDSIKRTFAQTYSNNTTYNYFVVEYGTNYTNIPQLNICFNWKNTAPLINADKALYTYIKNNNKLPNGINLSYLGYTNVIGSQTRSIYSSFDACWGFCATMLPYNDVTTLYITTRANTIESSAPNASISSIGKYDNSTVRGGINEPYYFNISESSSLVEYETTLFPLLTYRDSNLNFTGPKVLVELTASIYYSGPQKTFYESLAKKNIFIESTANMWDTDMYALKSENNVKVHQIIKCYSGFRVYYGLFNLSSDILNTGDNYKNIIKYIINGGTKPSSFNKSIVKNTLVSYASDSGLSRNLTTKYFGSSEMGTASWGETTGRNCCFIGFPTKFFNYIKLNSTLNQVWEGKFSGTGAWGAFGAAGTDSQNYIIDNVGITLSTSQSTVNYTFIIAKTTLQFKFGSSNSSGYGLRLTCQQTGLDKYNESL